MRVPPLYTLQEGSLFTDKVQLELETLLNGAARLTSFNGFQKLGYEEQIKVLIRYLHHWMHYRRSLTRAEWIIQDSFPLWGLVEHRVGTCAHFAALLAMLIEESGMISHLQILPIDEHPEQGHAWVKVEYPGSEKGTWLNGVADPTSNVVVFKTADQIIETAKSKPRSFSALYYSQPAQATVGPARTLVPLGASRNHL